MLSMRRVLVVLLSVGCVSLWASGIEATTVYFYATGNDNGGVNTLHQANWEDARDAETGDEAGFNETLTLGWMTGSMHFMVYRGFLAFDTDDLPDGAEVTSAELRLYCWSKWWEDEITDSVYVCGGLQSSEINV
ncbi:hypothetical protein AMJ39_09305 [candidate division TA06 bacterium DG_24]|uniref:Uncharacterized protein n=1 Tax=candidate division TA06 bacterium DG_24 TaxID=1703770 RepID=A0A0S7WP56_UNCT6|nr:MAG: hypothetical protein AMJ39_09305 [candidate division TA06 bacterium DG_24]